MKTQQETLGKSYSIMRLTCLSLSILISPFFIQTTAATPAIYSNLVFTQQTLIGSVFHDINKDGVQNNLELGLAGIRLMTVTGLMIETDRHGRFHIPNIHKGGKNTILKLDVSSLPQGATLTTENPRVIKSSNSGLNRTNFGIQL